MKRFFSVCIAVFLLLSAVTAIFAVDAPDVNVDVTGFVITINVTTDTPADKAVTAYIRSATWSDKKLYGISNTKVYAEDNGVYVYTLRFVMQTTDLTGSYVAYVNCDTAVTKAFDYVSPSDKVNYYNALDSAPAVAADNVTSDTIYDILTDERYDTYVYREAEYAALSPTVRAMVDKEIENWNLTATLETVGAIEADFKARMDEVLVRAEIANSAEKKSTPEQDAIAATSFETAVSVAANAGKLDDTYYSEFDVDGKATVRNMMNPATLTGITYNELSQRFSESVALAVYNTMDYLMMSEVYAYYAEQNIVEPLDASKMSKIKASEPFRLMKLSIDNVNSIDELEENLETYVDAAIAALPSGGSVGGGSSTGGSGASFGGSGAGAAINVNQNANVNNESKVSFSDLGYVSWAETAINELACRGIVSGRGDGKFHPNDHVSREEFAKMIVLAFRGYDANAICEFSDVNRDGWSYSYIASAYELGLVTGVDSNNFDPTGVITREQMAVILNRAYEATGKSVSDSALGFVDSDKISNYAKDAVAKLSNLGIMNGVGENRFEPKEYVTRAQAAKAIYETINAAQVK